MRINACLYCVLQGSHILNVIILYNTYQGTLTVRLISFSGETYHLDINLELDVSADCCLGGLCCHTKSFYFMSNFLFNWVESQNRFYKIVLELALQRQESYNQPGFSVGRNIVTILLLRPLSKLLSGATFAFQKTLRLKKCQLKQ